MVKDLFNDQEYINPAEFTAATKRFAPKMLRDLKNDIETYIHESPTGIELHSEEPKKKHKVDLSQISWHVGRQIRRIGFTDKGAFSGLYQEGMLEHDEPRNCYYYRESDYQIEHCRPIRVVTLRLIAGYYYKIWDCDKHGMPTKGLTFLQETIFKGIATIRIVEDSHRYLTEEMNKYLSDKGLDDINFLVTLRDYPDRMQEVWDWFDQGMHYEKVGIKFYPNNIMNILPYQKRVVPQHNKPHVGLVGNYQRFVSTKIKKGKIKPYVKKKDRLPKITLESKGFFDEN